MIKFGTRKARNGKKGRGYDRFSRGTKRMKNFEGLRLSMKVGKWTEVSIKAEHLRRFLLSNVGRPIDKVFSEFLERCDKTITNPKETFSSWIKKKEELGCRGGFYVTNGILNYKKRRKPVQRRYISYQSLNEGVLPSKEDILTACRKAKDTQKAVLLGRFYVYDTWHSHSPKLEAVYVKPRDVLSVYTRIVSVAGIGEGIDVYEESSYYKPRTKIRFLQSYEFSYGLDVYELVIKERK